MAKIKINEATAIDLPVLDKFIKVYGCKVRDTKFRIYLSLPNRFMEEGGICKIMFAYPEG